MQSSTPDAVGERPSIKQLLVMFEAELASVRNKERYVSRTILSLAFQPSYSLSGICALRERQSWPKLKDSAGAIKRLDDPEIKIRASKLYAYQAAAAMTGVVEKQVTVRASTYLWMT